MKKKRAKNLLEEFSESAKRYVITDFGQKLKITPSKGTGVSVLGTHLPQYSVWEVDESGDGNVVEVGDNLAALQRTYNVDDDHVYPIKS
jgi:hypothetical protein